MFVALYPEQPSRTSGLTLARPTTTHLDSNERGSRQTMLCSTRYSKTCSAPRSLLTHRAPLPHPTSSLGTKIRPHFAEPHEVCQGQYGDGCLYPNRLRTPSRWSVTLPSILHIVARHGLHTLSREASQWRTSSCLCKRASGLALMTTCGTRQPNLATRVEYTLISRRINAQEERAGR